MWMTEKSLKSVNAMDSCIEQLPAQYNQIGVESKMILVGPISRYALVCMALIAFIYTGFGSRSAYAVSRVEYKMLGEFLEGEDVPIELSIKNDGAVDWKLNVNYSYKRNQKRLKPGEATKINLTLNTMGVHGRLKRSVVVMTGDPANPLLRYECEAYVIAREVYPKQFDVGDIHIGAEKDIEFSLECLYSADELKFEYDKMDIENIKLLDTRMLDGKLAGSVASERDKEYTRRNKIKRVMLRYQARFKGQRYGSYNNSIKVIPQNKKSRPFDLNYSMNVRGDIIIEPEYLNFGYVKPGTSKKLRLSIRKLGGDQVQDAKFTFPRMPFVSVKSLNSKRPDVKNYEFTLCLPKNYTDTTDIVGNIDLRVNEDGAQAYPVKLICHPDL
jgi:hypothetical protein